MCGGGGGGGRYSLFLSSGSSLSSFPCSLCSFIISFSSLSPSASFWVGGGASLVRLLCFLIYFVCLGVGVWGNIFSSLLCTYYLFAALPYHFAPLLGGWTPVTFSFSCLLFLSCLPLLLAYAPSSSFSSAFGSSPPGLPLPHLQPCLSPHLSSSASLLLSFRFFGSFSSSFIFLLGFGGCTRVGCGSSFVFWGPLFHCNHPLLPRLALLSWRLVAACFRFSLLLLFPSLLSQSSLSSSSLRTSPVVSPLPSYFSSIVSPYACGSLAFLPCGCPLYLSSTPSVRLRFFLLATLLAWFFLAVPHSTASPSLSLSLSIVCGSLSAPAVALAGHPS